MKKKRKAQASGGTIGIIGAFILVLLVVFFMGKMFRGTAEAAGVSIGAINQEQRHQLCELRSKKIIEKGQVPKEDIEKNANIKGVPDGFLDECDLCLGGDDRIVTNLKGIPDACYSDPNKKCKDKEIKSYKNMCKLCYGGCYISDTGQCCLKYEPGINCPTRCK